MINEFKSKEGSEIKTHGVEKFKEINPKNGMTYEVSKEYWSEQFADKETTFVDAPKTYYDDNGEKYRVGDSLEPDTQFERNGYKYDTDELGRVVCAEGKLQVKDHQGRYDMPDSRDVVAQGKMADSDDRGHLLADRFNGSGELENLVPMDGKLNKGDYAKLENTLTQAVNDGADVRFKNEPVYTDDTNIPSEFRVTYEIDGDKEVVVFKNRSGD